LKVTRLILVKTIREVEVTMTTKGGLAGIFMTFLLMVIALALTPTIQSSVTSVTGTGAGNLTGAALALAGLIPLFWVIIILAIGIAAVYVEIKGLS
jgi:hypothetical protein